MEHMYKQNRVLVVEDNEINAMVLENMLKHFNLSVDIASSGAEAIERAGTNDYKLILVDYIMPEMDGIETTARIRKVQMGKPAIFAVTAEITDKLLASFMEAGADGALEKPVNRKAIEECLAKYIDSDEADEAITDTAKTEDVAYNVHIKELFMAVPGLDFEYGMHFSMNSETSYIRMAKASVKNIGSFLSELKSYESLDEEENTKLRIVTHSLRTVLLNLGIKGLSSDAARLEEATNKNDRKFIEFQLEDFIEKLEVVYQELGHAIDAYYELCSSEEIPEVAGKTVSKEEYQDMIRQVMVPLERYEIEFIKESLRALTDVSKGSNRKLVDEALEAAEQFDYETIRNCIKSLE